MWIGLLLLVVTFLVFAVYYGGYRQTISHSKISSLSHGQVEKQKTIQNWSCRFFRCSSFCLARLWFLLAVLGLRKIEQKNLFAPTKLDRYRKLSGMIYSLPSGGLVLNTTPKAPTNARRILFLHGNMAI